MIADQQQCIENRKADFVFVKVEDTDKIATLDSLNYTRYDIYPLEAQAGWNGNIIYSKNPLPTPPAKTYVTPIDILLKRKIF